MVSTVADAADFACYYFYFRAYISTVLMQFVNISRWGAVAMPNAGAGAPHAAGRTDDGAGTADAAR